MRHQRGEWLEGTEVIGIVGLQSLDVIRFGLILTKTSNVLKHNESNIQNIEAPRTDDPII